MRRARPGGYRLAPVSAWITTTLRLACGVGLLVSTLPARAGADGSARETILFIRHGEKPAAGLGQLNCQGLNRALALPAVIRRKYRRLDAVFAPNPAKQKPDNTSDGDQGSISYDYVRPLATAEPTAIAFGLPVQAGIGYADIADLQAALLAPGYRDATVLVAWEHHQLYKLVSNLMRTVGGDPTMIEKWPKTDFDSIWRVTIERTGPATRVTFARDQEGLDGQPSTCPN